MTQPIFTGTQRTDKQALARPEASKGRPKNTFQNATHLKQIACKWANMAIRELYDWNLTKRDAIEVQYRSKQGATKNYISKCNTLETDRL